MRIVGIIFLVLSWFGAAETQERAITVASTTSTEQSGLFGYLLPQFSKAEGIAVKVVAVGTGQALDIGRRGDADVVFVHDRPAEDKFMAEEQGVRRFDVMYFDVMYNDFVIVGPKSDPAHIAGDKDVVDALRKIAAAKAAFISRGDHSGTHEAELRLWKQAGIDVGAPKDGWYREIGQGMGPALNMASSSNAYLLSDRGIWLSFKNRGDLAILTEGDKRLFNQYGVMLVNPAKHRKLGCEIANEPLGNSSPRFVQVRQTTRGVAWRQHLVRADSTSQVTVQLRSPTGRIRESATIVIG